MAKSWADLSKAEREATGMTKAEYNKSTGYRAEVVAKSKPSSNTSSNTSSSSSGGSSSGSSGGSSGSSGSSSGSNRSDAVERSQSWADLSKKDKKAAKADGQTKKSYNKSTGYRAEQRAIDEQDSDPENTKYSDMSDDYKSRVKKADHKQARRDAETYTNDRLESYNVDSLDDFDITLTGRGRKEGQNRLSVTELKKLHDAGFSKEEIYNRSMEGEWSDAKRGTKAQALLDSWLSEFTTEPVNPPPGGGTNPPPGGGTNPPPGGGTNPPPGGGTNPPPGGGTNPPPGGGTNPPPGGGTNPPPGGGTNPPPGGGTNPPPGSWNPPGNNIWQPGDGNIGVIGTNNGIIQGGNNNVNVGGDNNGQIANNGGVAMGEGAEINQRVGSQRGDTNSEFTMGDGSWFIGNNNQGNDYSVNIGWNQVGGGGGYGGGGTSTDSRLAYNPLANTATSVGFGALNNNAWYRSQSDMSGVGRSAQAIAQAEQMSGSTERIAGYDYAARSNPIYWDAQSKLQTNTYLGDIWNMSPPVWTMPDPLRDPNEDNDDD